MMGAQRLSKDLGQFTPQLHKKDGKKAKNTISYD
jgi:aminoglycoside/choline kinase family phosphotransferase